MKYFKPISDTLSCFLLHFPRSAKDFVCCLQNAQSNNVIKIQHQNDEPRSDVVVFTCADRLTIDVLRRKFYSTKYITESRKCGIYLKY